jgi:prolipoprotein diacylglyceryltransferase
MTACAGVLGAKLHSVIERGGALFPLQQELTQGYRYPGAIVALVIVVAVAGRWFSRGLSLAALGDALAPSVGVGAALLRVGCFLSGCCFGVRSDLPWAVSFPAQRPAWHAHLGAGWIQPTSEQSLPVHPLQLYFVGLSLGAALVAWWVQRRKRFDGQALLTFLTIDGIGKALLEFLRATRPPSVQALSLMVGWCATTGLVVMSVRARSRGNGAKVRGTLNTPSAARARTPG